MTTTATGHEAGKTYRSTYWRQNYTVLKEIFYDDGRGDCIHVKWQDGRETIHSTRRDKDPEVTP